MASVVKEAVRHGWDGLPTQVYRKPDKPLTNQTVEERAQIYLDYLIECDAVRYATQDEYDAALARLIQVFGAK